MKFGMENFKSSFCTNCALGFKSTSQFFGNITVVDASRPFKSREVAIFDAISQIYGFSSTSLAIAYFDKDVMDNSFCKEVFEASELILERGLLLCSECVPVFRDLYVAHRQLKKLSSENSLLMKAIKKYSSSPVKLEVESDDCNYGIGSDEGEESFNDLPNLDDISPHGNTIIPKVESDSSEELFHTFDFEQNNEEYCDGEPENIKIDVSQDVETSNEFITDDGRSISLSPPTVSQNVDNVVTFYDNSDAQSKRGFLRKKYSGRNKNKPKYFGKRDSTKKSRPRKCDLSSCSSNINLPNKQLSPPIKSYLTRKAAASLPAEELNVLLPKFDTGASKHKPPKPKRIYSEERLAAIRQQLSRLREEKKKKKSRKRILSQPPKGCYKKAKIQKKDTNVTSVVEQTVKIDSKCVEGKSSGMSDFEDQEGINESEDNDDIELIPQPKLTSVPEQKTNGNIIECSCGRLFGTLKGLSQHEYKEHKSPEPQVCDECGQMFARKYSLYAHKSKKHSQMEDLVMKCGLCNSSFVSNSLLKKHTEENHSANQKLYICDKCGKGFKSLEYFYRHSRIHKDEALNKTFECSECGIVLKHVFSLQKHIRIVHKNSKIFSCPQCGKTTKNMTNMRIHMKVHDPNRILKRTPSNKSTEKSSNFSKCEEQL